MATAMPHVVESKRLFEFSFLSPRCTDEDPRFRGPVLAPNLSRKAISRIERENALLSCNCSAARGTTLVSMDETLAPSTKPRDRRGARRLQQ